MNRKLLTLLPLLLLIPVGVLLYSGLGKNTQLVPSPYLGKELPKIAGPDLLTGQLIELAQFKGTPIIVNVWASWCVACVDEHPVFNRYRESADAVPIVGIAYRDKAEDARNWLAQLGNPFTAIIHDETGRIGIDLGITGAPETFFIDANGRVRYKHIGGVDSQIIASKVAELKS
jgi:cytochrome c biogenesis protein CcmG, thiol:disulfide interchange protein DsbE